MHLIILPSFIIVLNLVALITRLIFDSEHNPWLILLNVAMILLGILLLMGNMKIYQRKTLSDLTKDTKKPLVD